MAHSDSSTSAAGMTHIQAVIGLDELSLVEAYRKAKRFSSRAQAVRALIAKGLEAERFRN